MTISAAPPVRRSMFVQASQQDAFATFTSRMGSWWNPAFSINPARSPIKEVMIEGRVGGKWFERGVDGSECQWGKVLTWDPPRKVALAWQITSQWQFGAQFMTEVEVRFTPEGTGTLVELEHRLLERYENAETDIRAQLESPGGWGGLLERFRRSVDSTR
jgi:uncharacterized protein YndB with AHSA1/START domain